MDCAQASQVPHRAAKTFGDNSASACEAVSHTLSFSGSEVLTPSGFSLNSSSPGEASFRLLLGDRSKLAIPETCMVNSVMQCARTSKVALTSDRLAKCS